MTHMITNCCCGPTIACAAIIALNDIFPCIITVQHFTKAAFVSSTGIGVVTCRERHNEFAPRLVPCTGGVVRKYGRVDGVGVSGHLRTDR
jgi:hypothetical protein